MFPYHVDVTGLPFQAGDDLYAVSVEQGYTIVRNRNAIDGVVVMKHGIGILAYGTLFLEEDQDCLISLEHAQAWVRTHRPALPCPYEDLADCWLPVSETLPAGSRAVWVLSDGEKRPACFEEETGMFCDENGQQLASVTEWTDNPEAERHGSILEVQEEDRREPAPRHAQDLE